MQAKLTLTLFGSILSAISSVYSDSIPEEEVMEPLVQNLYPLDTDDSLTWELDNQWELADQMYSTTEDSVHQPIEIVNTSKQHPFIEAKAGYFFFTDRHMHKVYKHGGIDVQLSGSYPLYKGFLHAYASVEYLHKSGHSLHGHQKTTLWEVPVSLGLRPVFQITDHIEYYFTLGPRYFFVHTHNHSSYVPRKMHANGCGGFVNTGLLFIIGCHFTIDVFGEYSYRMLHFHSHKKRTEGHKVQVGGLTFGGGLGWSF